MAKQVPGKEEFYETIRYFLRRLELDGVDVRLGTYASAEDLTKGGYDSVVLATGVTPRGLGIPGDDHPKVRERERRGREGEREREEGEVAREERAVHHLTSLRE